MINYETFTLTNGLKVIVHQDKSIPKVVFNILYRVGSKDEESSRTGFAHLFEHLMFRGSKNIPKYDTPLQRVGGQNNAFTSADVTNYYLNLPANQLETAFWLESDRMLELGLTEEKLETEKEVVINEYKQRYLNQPYGDAQLRMREMAFKVHPYRWTPIGQKMSHIAQATMEDVKDFFYGYYAPNNATLVVAGDVDMDQVHRLTEKWFGPIPKRPLKKHLIEQEPAQETARQETCHGPVPHPAVYKMYHIPAHTDPNYYTFEIIAALLASGTNSRLYQKLVKQQKVAMSVSAFSWQLHDPGVMSIDGHVAEGHSIAAYETAVQETLNELQNTTEADLQRMKNKLEAGHVMEQTSLFQKALNLAFSDTLGDVRLTNEVVNRFHNVTLNQVKEAAATYFVPNNASTLYYLPEQRQGLSV